MITVTVKCTCDKCQKEFLREFRVTNINLKVKDNITECMLNYCSVECMVAV